MQRAKTQPATSLYHDDEIAWLEYMSKLIAERRFDELDYDHLREYLQDMVRRDKREVLSRLTFLLVHLLKWEHQPTLRSNSWQATILHQRQELADLLESAVLRQYAIDSVTRAYDRAVKQAAVETVLDEGTFPAMCAWTLEEVLVAD
ncbi:MAG: DUF29 domain-containing protein [Phycisphaeraceae bacterium]